MNNKELEKYYSDDSFWDKIKRYAKKAGIKVTYSAILLYHVMKDENVPTSTKAIVGGALGYFILPFDFVFDVIPFMGYLDDIGVLLLALNQVAKHVTPEMQEKAKTTLTQWFGQFDDEDVSDIDSRIN